MGYSRVVRVGTFISVSGTTWWDSSGTIIGKGDAYAQTVQIIKNIESALKKARSGLADVVRTRVYLKNIDDWQKAAKAHAEFFSKIKPASATVVVSGFVDSDILVEVEADAISEKVESN